MTSQNNFFHPKRPPLHKLSTGKPQNTGFHFHKDSEFFAILIKQLIKILILYRAEAKDSLHQALHYELPDTTIHAMKLLQNSVFLPGYHDFQVGTLLKCSDGGGTIVSNLRPKLPSTKAVYMHSLKIEGNTCLGEVLAVAFLPSGNPVVLMSAGKKVIPGQFCVILS